MRVMLGGLLAGVGGAVLIAVLVLGRGDAADVALEFAALDGGGVLMSRVEVYQRHGAKAEEIAGLLARGDRYLFPERYITEAWMLLGPQGEMVAIATVTWTEDGELLERTSLIGTESVSERPGMDLLAESTLPGGGLGRMQVLPSELLAVSRVEVEDRLAGGEWELIAPARSGTLVLVRARPVQWRELEAQERRGFVPPYYADLEVIQIVEERTYSNEYWPTHTRRWVVLDDGSRVLVESRRIAMEARGAEEWDGFVARVWGD